MNPKFHVGDTVRILNMREEQHNKNVGVIIDVDSDISKAYHYNVRIFVGKCEYRYWRAEKFLEVVEIKPEKVVFT